MTFYAIVIDMIDKQGFRPNVGIIVVNNKQQVLWARRARNKDAWQFPQGGIDEGESAKTCMLRELYEEVGLTESDISILAETKDWLRYRLPKKYLRHCSLPLCIGQKQKWFLLQLLSDDQQINLSRSKTPEFNAWQWVDYWYPAQHVIAFKQKVYQKALQEFAPIIFGK